MSTDATGPQPIDPDDLDAEEADEIRPRALWAIARFLGPFARPYRRPLFALARRRSAVAVFRGRGGPGGGAVHDGYLGFGAAAGGGPFGVRVVLLERLAGIDRFTGVCAGFPGPAHLRDVGVRAGLRQAAP